MNLKPEPRALGNWARYASCSAGLLLLAAVSMLYVWDTPTYVKVMTAWMDRPYSHPFMDWEWFPAAAACWSKGINVYIANPCYLPIPEGAHNYPPLWLRLSFLSAGQDYVGTTGLAMAVGFFLVLSRLPAPTGPSNLLLVFLASISSLVAFALERANVDVLIFIATVLAVCQMERPLRYRLAAYCTFMLLGMLKFYPWVLLALAIRERPRVLVAIWTIGTAVFVGYTAMYHHESAILAERGLPKAAYIVDMIGAVNLPGGISTIAAASQTSGTSQTSAGMDRSVFNGAMATLLTLSALAVAWLNAGRHLATGLCAVPARELNLLAAGSLLMVLCFFAGQSVGYRAIFLLLCLPGLLALGQQVGSQSRKAALRAACIAMVFVMWVSLIEWLLKGAAVTLSPNGSVVAFRAMHWLIREMAWWMIIVVLVSITVAYMWQSLAVVLEREVPPSWTYGK